MDVSASLVKGEEGSYSLRDDRSRSCRGRTASNRGKHLFRSAMLLAWNFKVNSPSNVGTSIDKTNEPAIADLVGRARSFSLADAKFLSCVSKPSLPDFAE